MSNPISIYSGQAPSEMATMEEKSRTEYGALYAAHMWNAYWMGGCTVGLRSWEDYMYLRSVAHGRESMDNVKRYMNLIGEEKEESYTWFNVQVLNFATRFINLAKEKINNIDYDISIDAIDPLSISEKKEFERTAKAVLQMRELLDVYGKKYQELMPPFPEGWQPSSVEEIQVYMQTTHKIEDEIKAELAIKGDLDASNWPHIKNMMVDDHVTCGPAACRVFVDHNGDRKIKYVPIERFMCSTPNDESFDNIVYAGEIEYITAEQFMWETAGVYTREEQEQIIKDQSSYQGYGRYDNNGYWYGGYFPDGKKYLAVLRFEFLSADRKVWVKSTNEKGKSRIDEKESDYEPGTYTVIGKNGERKKVLDEALRDQEMAKYDSGKKKLIVDNRKSCYGGTWVIGSKICYNYGMLESGKDVRLGYKAWAPNMRNGFVTSMTKQILEPLELAYIAHTQIKTILGQGYLGIVDIDFSALSNVSYGKGGSAWTAKQALDFFFEKKVGVHNGVSKGNGGKAFTLEGSGLTLADYMNTIQMCVNNMVAITGVNPMVQSGTNISAQSMEVDNQTTNDALGYLYRAYHQTYKAVGRQLLGYNPAFYNNYIYQRQFIVNATKGVTMEERNQFMARLNKYSNVPLEQGGLTASQETQIGLIKNLKQANLVLAYMVEKNISSARNHEMEKMKTQGQLNDQNAKIASDIRKQEMEFTLNLELVKAKQMHNYKMEEIGLENQGVIGARQVQMEWTHANVKQQGSDSITKESIKASAAIRDTEMKNAKDFAEKSLDIIHDNHLTDKQHAHEKEQASKEEKKKSADKK